MVKIKTPVEFRLFALIAGILAVAALFSCSNPDEWNPEGTIRLLQLREAEEDGKKYAYIDYVIRNTGKSTIAAAVASFSLQTDSRSYYFTVTTDCALPPDRLLYETTQIAYITTTESAVLENLAVDSCHFE